VSGSRSAIAAFGLALLCAGPALANDTSAELRAGGLVYGRSDVVSIESETLYLSMDRVSVDYVFHNHADTDVETVVAFPMPDIAFGPDANIAIPQMDDNFLGFSVVADGQAIRPELQQRAYAAGVDVTDVLEAAGLPVSPLAHYDNGLHLADLPQETLADLVSRGIVVADYDAASGRYGEPVEPVWTLKSAYWWRMTFPANADLAVHHDYTPAVGGTVGVYFMDSAETAADYAHRYCTDASFVSGLEKRQRAVVAKGGYGYQERWLSYVLTTGGNWAGAIGRFRLIIDKGSTDNLVSFCGEGVKKVGPTTFQMEKTDFWPTRDLDILFAVSVDQ
jgi:hypothetical protein